MNIYTKHKQNHWFRIWLIVILSALTMQQTFAQNSMIGDGFGGNPGYTPVNYSVGSYSAYASCSGTLKGWGDNYYYPLGNGTQTASLTPVNILTNVKYFSAGDLGTAIKNDNTLWAWGKTSNSDIATTPTQFATDVKFVDAGTSHLSYTKNDGTAWVIGYDNVYQTTAVGNTPHQVTGISNCVRVASGGDVAFAFTVFLLSDGTVKYIGGSTGVGSVTYQSTPTDIGLSNVVDIKASLYVLYALKSDGTVWTMGNSSYHGGLGNGTMIDSPSTPVKVLIPNGVSIKAISSCDFGNHALALSTTGDVYAWGLGLNGVLGTGNTNNQSAPVLVASNVKDIMAGGLFSYIYKNDGTFWATGSDQMNIWMNLPDLSRNSFTQINPSIPPMNLCVTVCSAGSTAPTLGATTKSNTCPATTVDLTTITASNLPANTNLTWHTGTSATTANKVTNSAAITTAGTYYAAFFDATNDCYSSATTAVTATLTTCSSCNAGSSAPSLIKD